MIKVQYYLNKTISYFHSVFWGYFGEGTKIIKPMRIINKKSIFLGKRVNILNNARMEAIEGKWGNQKYSGKIIIRDGTSIEQNCHIIAAKTLEIGEDCVLSANVYISDCSHGYEPSNRIMEQSLQVKKTNIGKGCFIGYGACIMPGVTLGDHVVVGANAVVTHDVEPYSIVAGVPARVISILHKT